MMRVAETDVTEFVDCLFLSMLPNLSIAALLCYGIHADRHFYSS